MRHALVLRQQSARQVPAVYALALTGALAAAATAGASTKRQDGTFTAPPTWLQRAANASCVCVSGCECISCCLLDSTALLERAAAAEKPKKYAAPLSRNFIADAVEKAIPAVVNVAVDSGTSCCCFKRSAHAAA